MHMKSRGKCLLSALAVAVSAGACARTPPTEQEGNSTISDSGNSHFTRDGYTYTDAPVDVKLGPSTFRIPANYLDSQIAPWPGEGVTLVIEWPDMVATEPGARAHPRTNDFRKEILIDVTYRDRAPIETSLERHSSNQGVTEEGSLEREDPRDRLDLRVPQVETMGLTPYAIDESRMAAYAEAYTGKFGHAPPRSMRSEADWYVARKDSGALSTFIRCDSKSLRPRDGLRIEGSRIIDDSGEGVAGCTHYITDIENKLLIVLNYSRAFLKDWKRMEDATRTLLSRSQGN